MYFSMRRRSYTWPVFTLTTGSCGVSPDTSTSKVNNEIPKIRINQVYKHKTLFTMRELQNLRICSVFVDEMDVLTFHPMMTSVPVTPPSNGLALEKKKRHRRKSKQTKFAYNMIYSFC
jgi:hypothetical protein